jgi:hypothetical protein
MAFEVIMGTDCIFEISTAVQAAFGTRLADAYFESAGTGGRRIRLNTATLGEFGVVRAGGGPKPGSRTEHPVASNERIVGHDSSLSLNMDADSFVVGWALSHIFQDVSSGSAGTNGIVQHEMHCSDPLLATTSGGGRSSVITSVYLDSGGPDAGRLQRVMADMAIQAATLSGKGKDIVTLAVEMPGSGLIATDPTITPIDLPAQTLLANDNFKLEYGTRGGSLTDISERVDTWSLRFNKVLALDQGYYPGSGYYRKRLWFLRRTFSIELALYADRASADLVTDLINQTREEIQITLQNGLHKLVLRYPDVRITESPVQFREEGAVYPVRVAEDQVFYDSEDADSPCTATLDNDVAAYLID